MGKSSKITPELPPLINTPLAGEFWVAKNGNDTTGNGSKTNPFLTVQRGITAAAISDVLINIMPGDYTENLVFDGNAGSRILFRGVGIEDQHRTKIIGFHTFVNAATRISFEDIQMADGGTLGNIFDFTDSDGRHYFKNITFNLTNAGSRPGVSGNNMANWQIFHDCTMAGEFDMTVGTITGNPLLYFQECTGAYGVLQAQGVAVNAFGCVVAPYVNAPGLGVNGVITMANCDFISADIGGGTL